MRRRSTRCAPFTDARTRTRPTRFSAEHPPVYTQGLAGKAEHVLARAAFRWCRPTRGGQVTFHGPQVVAHPLVDLEAPEHLVKEYVFRLEQALKTLDRPTASPGIGSLKCRASTWPLGDPFGHAARSVAPGAPDPDPGSAARRRRRQGHAPLHLPRVALNGRWTLAPFGRHQPGAGAGTKTIDLCYNRGRGVAGRRCRDTFGRKLAAYLGPRLSAEPPRARHDHRHPGLRRQHHRRRRPRPRASRSRRPGRRDAEKPDWIRVKAGSPTRASKEIIGRSCANTGCNTVCEEASCPEHRRVARAPRPS